MNRETLLLRLGALAEPSYQVFSARLLPPGEPLLGVRLPALHRLAGEIAGEDWRVFLAEDCGETLEERLVRGLVIACAPMELSERLCRVRDFLPLIRNWSVCDSFCAALKTAEKEQNAFYELLLPCLSSEEEYRQRFGLVMLTDWFLSDPYIDRSLEHFFSFSHPAYYARMAAAWGISVAFVRYPEKTLPCLADSRLDVFTHNMAIRKIRESRRVSPEQKALVLTMKKEPS